MNSLPSSSSANGIHANGAATHPENRAQSPSSAYQDQPAEFNSGFILENHDAEILNHLYSSGFQTGNYADTILHVGHQGHGTTYRLHAIILSRSPLLAHLMSTSPQGSNGQRVIYVQLEGEPEVTPEGFAIALGYLYSSMSMRLIHEKNCRAVLASARALGGMDELASYAYDACRRSISVESIDDWLHFINNIPDGSATPDLTHPSIFGPYAERLRQDVLNFLIVTLPQNPDTDRDALLQVLSRVPFDLFKIVIESPTFQIGADQVRFKFAKDAIEIRKRGIARGAEETVVLSNFGGSAVHVTRKMRKRPLWKVNPTP